MARSGNNAVVPVLGIYPQTSAPTFGTDLTEIANNVAQLLANDVATADDLPVAGDYVGQHRFVRAEKRDYVYDGTIWSAVGESTAVTISTFGPNWTAVAGGYAPYVMRTGKRREVFGLALRVNTGAPIANICTVEVADRPSTNVMLSATADSGGTTGQLFIQPNGVIGVAYGNVGATVNKPLVGTWYV